MINQSTFVFLYKDYYKFIFLNIRFISLIIYYKNFLKNFYLLFNNFNIFYNIIVIKKIYTFFLKIINIFILNIIISNNFLKKIMFPNSYTLTTILRSPHIDKRSREQFHLIYRKTSVFFPLFFSIGTNKILNNLFLLNSGFNVISKINIIH